MVGTAARVSAKIAEAEEAANNSRDESARKSWRAIADSNRRLLKQINQLTTSKNLGRWDITPES